jgi:hypothetical protein
MYCFVRALFANTGLMLCCTSFVLLVASIACLCLSTATCRALSDIQLSPRGTNWSVGTAGAKNHVTKNHVSTVCNSLQQGRTLGTQGRFSLTSFS